MKSIIYLSDYGDRPCRPVAVEHDPRFPPFEHFKHHDPRCTGTCYQLKYCCTITPDMGIHQKINCRAEHIGKTAWNYGHHRATPPGWGRRKQGPDYQWYLTPERIARSRFRKARRLRKQNRWHQAYCAIDFSFGLFPASDGMRLDSAERRHLHARLKLSATSRAPLPPWSLIQCYDQAA